MLNDDPARLSDDGAMMGRGSERSGSRDGIASSATGFRPLGIGAVEIDE